MGMEIPEMSTLKDLTKMQEEESVSQAPEEENDPRLSLKPGEMTFCKDLKDPNRQFAQVWRTQDDKFAVLRDWPGDNMSRPRHLRYDPDVAATGSAVYATLAEANKALLKYAETNHLAKASSGYAPFEGFDKEEQEKAK
jgi:hypothetical protein